jgi:hypothetical protein
VPLPAEYEEINLGVRPAADLDDAEMLCAAGGFVEVGAGAELHYEATFDRGTPQIAAAFAAAGQTARSLPALIDIQLSDAGDSIRTTPVKQAAAIITRDIYRGDEPEAIGAASAARVVFFPTITGLTGGTATDLDSIPTASASVPRICCVVIDGALRAFRLTAGTDAEDPDAVIRPDDFDPDHNPKIWMSVL